VSVGTEILESHGGESEKERFWIFEGERMRRFWICEGERDIVIKGFVLNF